MNRSKEYVILWGEIIMGLIVFPVVTTVILTIGFIETAKWIVKILILLP